MKAWPIIGVLGVLIAGGAVWAMQANAEQQSVVAVNGSVPIASDVATATLHSPSGNTDVAGVATRQFVDIVFAHGVTAMLPDLPPDQFYAGWLVKAADPTHPFPTGKFIRDGAEWTLSYSSRTDESFYDGVLVSVQTGEGQSLGTVVLEGTFLK